MDKQKCLDLAAYSAISCSAYFAGASLYINWVQVPTMFASAPDTRTLLREWTETYTRARLIQVCVLCTGADLSFLYFYLFFFFLFLKLYLLTIL